MLRKMKKGQSTMEYAIILIIVIGALLASQQYFKRGIQGRWKASIDDLADQYDPQATNSTIHHTLLSSTNTKIDSISTPGGLQTSRTDKVKTQDVTSGFTSVGPY